MCSQRMSAKQYSLFTNVDPFIASLPHKPYCANDLSFGLKIRNKEHALKHKHIQQQKEVNNQLYQIQYMKLETVTLTMFPPVLIQILVSSILIKIRQA